MLFPPARVMVPEEIWAITPAVLPLRVTLWRFWVWTVVLTPEMGIVAPPALVGWLSVTLLPPARTSWLETVPVSPEVLPMFERPAEKLPPAPPAPPTMTTLFPAAVETVIFAPPVITTVPV